ncbi:MAG: hypothetical protein EB015_04520 [Methylocystaceae bacterium]|jgi:hypothetical protein|nr:hypothetical protein [Methylocystaceae bacterium]NDB67266.1 hypothetical protein [Methylocystaceae bacterium]
MDDGTLEDRRRGPYYGEPRRQIMINMPESILSKLDDLSWRNKLSRTQQIFILIETALKQIEEGSNQ